MIPDVVCGLKDVEDGSKDGKGKAGTVVGGGSYRCGEVLADFGKEFVVVGGLADEVDEEVVGCSKFWALRDQPLSGDNRARSRCASNTFLGRTVQDRAGRDELFERLIFLTLLQ